jgi:hypothetical protein
MKRQVVKKKENLYWVDMYSDGYCYRSVHSCTWEEVKQIRKTAKMLGETIKYEKM